MSSTKRSHRDKWGERLAGLTGRRKWVSELVGLPTYFGAALLTIYSSMNFIAGTIAFVCFVMIYHYIYEFLFPGFEYRGRLLRLIAFLVAQMLVWGGAIVLIANR